jgi:hypothetical protein
MEFACFSEIQTVEIVMNQLVYQSNPAPNQIPLCALRVSVMNSIQVLRFATPVPQATSLLHILREYGKNHLISN